MSSSAQRYHIGSWIKIIIGVWLGILLYFLINPQEDPALAIGLLLVALFLVGWGASFYMFWAINSLARRVGDEALSDSYKMSLLFGFFIIINATLIFLEAWSKILGVILLLVFLGLFVVLFRQGNRARHDR